MKKSILKNIIQKLYLKRYNILNINNINNKLLLLLNKGDSKLQQYNNSNNYNHNIYQYNNNNMISNMLRDNLIGNLLIKYFNSKLLNTEFNTVRYIKYIISKPIYQHTSDKVNVIIFIYNGYDNDNIKNYNTSSINNNIILIRMIDNLNSNINNNNLTNILSQYYGKTVTIQPIILKYDYFNDKIFSTNISNNINIYNTYKKQYRQVLLNNVTLLEPNNLLNNYMYFSNTVNNIVKTNILNNISSNNTNISNTINNNNNIYMKDMLNKDNTIYNLLSNKYLIGFRFKFSGKLPLALSTARKITDIEYYGLLKHKISDKDSIRYKLNVHKSNMTMTNTSNINKKGTFNVDIKLNHI